MKSTATENKVNSTEYPTLYQNDVGDIILITDGFGTGMVVGRIPDKKGTWPLGEFNHGWVMSYLTKYKGTVTISTE